MKTDFSLGSLCRQLDREGTTGNLVWRCLRREQQAKRKKQMDLTRARCLQLSQQSTQGPSSPQASSPLPFCLPSPPQLVLSHRPDIQANMLAKEKFYFSRRSVPSVLPDPHARARLINWLVYIHGQLKQIPETLFLCVQLVDRVLHAQITLPHLPDLQLLGIVALLLASKYWEERVPSIDALLKSTNYAFTKNSFLATEAALLHALDFQIETHWSAYLFHRLFTFDKYGVLQSEVQAGEESNQIKKGGESDQIKLGGESDQVLLLSRYLIELALLDLSLQQVEPSRLAASSIYLSHKLLNRPLEILPGGYWEHELTGVASDLLCLLDQIGQYKYQQITHKFSSAVFAHIALLPAHLANHNYEGYISRVTNNL